ncbi:MAG: toxin HipA [Herminiimonas sp.]|nr:toxin HipA [Herminiimonas sp.]
MAVRSTNAHYRFDEIQIRHWHQLALKNGGPKVWDAMLQLVANADGALAIVEGLLPNDFPAHIWESISEGIRGRVERFHAGLLANGILAQAAP